MFKKGDIVKCVSDYDWNYTFLKLGETYEVTESENHHGVIKVAVADCFWSRTRFVLDVKEIRKQKINKIYEGYKNLENKN